MRSIKATALLVAAMAAPALHAQTTCSWQGSANLTANCDVGIGASSPGGRLHILGSQPSLLIEDSGTVRSSLRFFTGGQEKVTLFTDHAGSFHIETGGPSPTEKLTILNNGKIGVGITAPKAGVEVFSLSRETPRLLLSGQEFYEAGVSSTDGVALILGVNRSNNRQLWIANSSTLAVNGTAPLLRVMPAAEYVDVGSISPGAGPKPLALNVAGGNVGVGIHNPAKKLHVAGDIQVDGNINAKFQDIAEWVPATEALDPGMIVVVAPKNHVSASTTAYDTRVAGVVSPQPGLILGEAGDSKVMVATTGRVRVRVDATSGPIREGDLLVSSPIKGTAMKSEPLVH